MGFMASLADQLATYLHLARASELRGRLHVRDRLLVLAAVSAVQLKLTRIADCCRQRVLAHNPTHLLRRWPTFAAGCDDPEFAHFLRHLWRRYPPERAERMLVTLGIERGQERAAYYSDEEFGAALLGVTLSDLDQFGPADHP